MVKSFRLFAVRFVIVTVAVCGASDASRAADPLETDPAWTSEVDKVAAAVGFAVAGAGDVNADGIDDVIVGSPGYWATGGPGGSQHGAVFVYHGSSSGLSPTFDWSSIGPDQLSGYGTGVGAAGDVNGDGFDDVIYSANFMGIAPMALVC